MTERIAIPGSLTQGTKALALSYRRVENVHINVISFVNAQYLADGNPSLLILKKEKKKSVEKLSSSCQVTQSQYSDTGPILPSPDPITTIVCTSRATHRVLVTCNMLCHVARKNSSAIKFDRVQIAFLF